MKLVPSENKQECQSLHFDISNMLWFHIGFIPCQINTGHNPTPSELNDFLWDCSPNGHKYSCQILLLYGTRFLRAGIQSCQKPHFLSTSCLRKSGVTLPLLRYRIHFMLISEPYYSNIFSTVMFSRSSDFTFDLVFLKMRYFNVFLKNVLYACNCYLKHLQISSWLCNGIGLCEAVHCEESLKFIDEATSSNMFLLNSLHLYDQNFHGKLN
jgi:hypothetical protein